jgi:hypothetical protein
MWTKLPEGRLRAEGAPDNRGSACRWSGYTLHVMAVMDRKMAALGIAALAAPFIIIFVVLRSMRPGSASYQWAVGISLAAAFLIIWVALAVGIIGAPGDDPDAMYVVVLVIGGIGALIARFRPEGMARTLFVMAVAMAVVPVIALGTGIQQASATPVGVFLLFHGILVALFVASGYLFRRAAREPSQTLDEAAVTS